MADAVVKEAMGSPEKKEPLFIRVDRLLGEIVERKTAELLKAPADKQTLLKGQIARCYTIAVQTTEGEVGDNTNGNFDALKKYTLEHVTVLGQERTAAKKSAEKHPARAKYDKMKVEDQNKLDFIIGKARVLNDKAALKDPATVSDPAEKARVGAILASAAKSSSKDHMIPIADLSSLYSCDRMIRFAEKTAKAHDNALEVFADLQKIVPQKTP